MAWFVEMDTGKFGRYSSKRGNSNECGGQNVAGASYEGKLDFFNISGIIPSTVILLT